MDGCPTPEFFCYDVAHFDFLLGLPTEQVCSGSLQTRLEEFAMETTSLPAQEFSQAVQQALSAAERGPVFITDDGVRTHVLLSYADYQCLLARGHNVADRLGMPGGVDVEFEAPRVNIVLRPADLS